MVKLSADYNTTVKIGVNFSGLQNDKVILPSSDSIIEVNILTNGYNLLWRSFFPSKMSMNVNIQNYPIIFSGQNPEIHVESKNLADNVLQVLNKKERIVSINPVFLILKLDKAFSKKVPVLLDTEITYAKPYGPVKRIYLKPDSIVISGSAEIVKQTNFVRTERKVLENISSNTSLQLRLINNYPESMLKYSQHTVGIYIPVDKMVLDKMEIKVLTDSTFSGNDGNIEPSKVMVYYEVSNVVQKQITQDSFLFVVTKGDFVSNKPGLLRVIARKVPDNVRIIKIEPEGVEFNSKKP